MNPPNIITGTCETCGQLEHVEGNLLVCKYCQVEAFTRENKRLKEAGDKMYTLIIHMASTEWEEDHDPETEEYIIPEFYNDILKEWEIVKGDK